MSVQNLRRIQDAEENAAKLLEKGSLFEMLKEIFENIDLNGGNCDIPAKVIGERLKWFAEAQIEREQEQRGEVDAMDAYKMAREGA